MSIVSDAWWSLRHHVLLLGLTLIGISLDDITVVAQTTPCPSIENSSNRWSNGSTVYYAFTSSWNFSGYGQFEQGQMVQGLANWTSANQTSNGTNITFAPADATHPPTLNLTVGPTAPQPDGNIPPAQFQATQLNSDGSIAQATITFHLADTFPNGERVYQPSQPGAGDFLTKLTAHEAGHGMGMGNVDCNSLLPNCGWGDTVMGGYCGVNDQSNCLPAGPTPCDNTDVRQSYNTSEPCQPPPGCADWDYGSCMCLDEPPPDPCAECTCGAECMPQGGCGPPTVECSPIIIAVGSNSSYHLTSSDDGVLFDMNGDGIRERMSWTQAGDPIAFLVLDRNGNGNIENGSELFGNHSVVPSGQPVTNGFEALAWYDQNGGNSDGIMDARDPIWSSLRLWIDWNHDAVTQAGELYPLEQWGLSSISLQFQTIGRKDGHGNMFRLKAPCQLGNKTRFGYDVYFSMKPQKKPK